MLYQRRLCCDLKHVDHSDQPAGEDPSASAAALLSHIISICALYAAAELVRGSATDEDVMARLADYNDRILGKCCPP